MQTDSPPVSAVTRPSTHQALCWPSGQRPAAGTQEESRVKGEGESGLVRSSRDEKVEMRRSRRDQTTMLSRQIRAGKTRRSQCLF